jgi:hypothetical protein
LPQSSQHPQDEAKARPRLAALDLAHPKTTDADPGRQIRLIEPKSAPSILDQGADGRGCLERDVSM